MKVIIYMAITPNGLITKNGSTKFIQEGANRRFKKMMAQIRANLVGRGTYEASLKQKAFPYKGLNVVMTSKPIQSRWKNVIFTGRSPRQTLKLFEEAGYKTVMVGGGKINSLFMKEGLVDELYLAVQPKVFTEGTRLFDGVGFESKLKLMGAKKLSKNEIELHYKVIK